MCEAYNRSKQTGTIDENLEKDYKNHQLMKVMAREEKEKTRESQKRILATLRNIWSAGSIDHSMLTCERTLLLKKIVLLQFNHLLTGR